MLARTSEEMLARTLYTFIAVASPPLNASVAFGLRIANAPTKIESPNVVMRNSEPTSLHGHEVDQERRRRDTLSLVCHATYMSLALFLATSIQNSKRCVLGKRCERDSSSSAGIGMPSLRESHRDRVLVWLLEAVCATRDLRHTRDRCEQPLVRESRSLARCRSS